MFDKILIANRGEIACRVMRTCQRMAIKTVAVYSEADQKAMHVQLADEAYLLGGPRPVDSYLRGDLIIQIAKRCGAQAIHPGYGFLSENAAFSRAVEAAGLVFIGPTADAIDKMGSKSAAKRIMEAAQVPVVPGYHGDEQDQTFLRVQAERVGFPLLIKAVAGGGGKGMRLVESVGQFFEQLHAAKREAKNAFGDDAVLLERYVKGPHHIEFQVFGDTHGNYVHLFERECSIQRRHQKVLEEAPSPFLDQNDDDLRQRMGDAAVAAARAIHYRGAGTIEFIVGEDRQFYFMEMNTRLQVEHPVTEMTTGEDLVEWQLKVAAGEALPLKQTEIIRGGHAIEVRVCAENPANNFLPETGDIGLLTAPAGEDIRLDTGVRSGDTISVYYDSMIAKLIVWGGDRQEAIRRLDDALAQTAVIGVTTNVPFLQRIVRQAEFIRGHTDTGFIPRFGDALLAPEVAPDLALIAAAMAVEASESAGGSSWGSPWDARDGWWLNQGSTRIIDFEDGEATREVAIVTTRAGMHARIDGRTIPFQYTQLDAHQLQITIAEQRTLARVFAAGSQLQVALPHGRYLLSTHPPFQYTGGEAEPEGRLTALMPGRVVKLLVKIGEAVKKGQPLLILEAMKMEHTVASPKDGLVESIRFKENDLVPAEAVLFELKDA